jgi:pimeloyl-ACP methyl ester carboxylesterase
VAVVAAASCSGTNPTYQQGQAPLLSPAPAGSATTVAPPPSTAPAGPPVPPPLAWAPCTGESGPAGDQCATLQVPLDYKQPDGSTIGIALAMHPATGTRIGSLLLDPGGPGASGIDGLSTEIDMLDPSIIQHFDLVGFDPRGVARSVPVHCATGPQLDQFFDADPAPTTAVGFGALVSADAAFVAGCQAQSGPLLPHVGTADAARDMDQMRRALGEPTLNYFGFSYGSLLGATYADLFPTHIRAMVLDGAIDPAQGAISFTLTQAAAFNSELDAFFADCAAQPSCAWKPGGDLHSAFDALMASLKVRRLPGIGGRTLGPGEAFYGVALPLYDRASWPALAAALEAASRGDGSVLLHFSDLYTMRSSDGTYSNLEEANVAVNCLDEQWPKDPQALQAYAAQAEAMAPEFGLADLYGGLACSLWPVPATGQPHAVTAPGSPQIVVVGSTGDPATPYAGAKALASELSRGVLLTRVGDGHTGYRASACIRADVDRYLLDPSAPLSPATCPSP